MNPYWDADFFHFFALLFRRIATWDFFPIADDEIQLAVLSLSAISCGLVGPFLVLKRMAMFANSLSHTILVGMVAAFLLSSSLWGGALFDLSTLLLGALFAAFFTAFFTEGLVRLFKLQEDASVGLVFTALFALGMVLVTLYTRDAHIGVESVMGNVDALQLSDLRLTSLLVFINLSLVLLFFHRFQICSFDQALSKTLGIPHGLFHFLLLFMTAATCIGAFRSIGVLLVLAFLVGPYLTARLFFHRLSSLLLLSPLFGILATLLGVALSRHLLTAYNLPLSTGGIVTLFIGLNYITCLGIGKIKNGRSGLRAPAAPQGGIAASITGRAPD